MIRKPEPQGIPAGKIYLKLTIFGCFLLGFAYASLLLLNLALSAIR